MNTILPVHAAKHAATRFFQAALCAYGISSGNPAPAATFSVVPLPYSLVFVDTYLFEGYGSPDWPYFPIATGQKLTMRSWFMGDYRFEVSDSFLNYFSGNPLVFSKFPLAIYTDATVYYFKLNSRFLASGQKGCPTLISGQSAIVAIAETILPCDRIDGLNKTKYVLPPGAKSVFMRFPNDYWNDDSWGECLSAITGGATVVLPDGRSDTIVAGETYCENSSGKRQVNLDDLYTQKKDNLYSSIIEDDLKSPGLDPYLIDSLELGARKSFYDSLLSIDPASGRKRIEYISDVLGHEYGLGKSEYSSSSAMSTVYLSYATKNKGFGFAIDAPLHRKLSFDPGCQSSRAIEITETGEYEFCFQNHYGVLSSGSLGDINKRQLEKYLMKLDKLAYVVEEIYPDEKKGVYIRFKDAIYRFLISVRSAPNNLPVGIQRVYGSGALAFKLIIEGEGSLLEGWIRKFLLYPYVPLAKIRQILLAQGYTDFEVYWTDDALVVFTYQGINYKTIPLLLGEECSLKGKESFYVDGNALVFEIPEFGCQRFMLSESEVTGS